MTERYEKILSMKHHTSGVRRRMTKEERAAQFAPYAALSGYDSAVKETARLTSRRIELDDYEIERLNSKLLYISERLGVIRVAVTYFVPDKRKAGGAYITEVDAIKGIDEYSGTLITLGGVVIPISEIISIEEAFDGA